MKIHYLFILAAVLLAACSPPSVQEGSILLADRPAANGRWMVINYWATWCHPCREEIPELNDFARIHASDVIVYGVNFDGAMEDELLVQANELGITFTQLRTDPASQLGYARPTVLPTTMVINPRGEIQARLMGRQTVDSLETAMEPERQP